MSFQNGECVHGEVNAANVSSATTITFYGANGVARPLASNERYVVRSYIFTVGAAQTITIFADKDGDDAVDAGEIIAKGTFGASGGGMSENSIEHPCPVGKAIKVLSSTTDVVNCVIRAEIFPA